MTQAHWTWLGRAWLVAFAGSLALAVFTPRAKTCDVEGTVTYRGKPVTTGAVVIHAADGKSVAAPIGSDGRYKAAVAPGAVQVAVVSRDPAMQQYKRTRLAAAPDSRVEAAPAVTADRKAWVALPARVENPATSGLGTSVSGDTQFDIAIP